MDDNPYSFPDHPVIPTKPLVFDDSELAKQGALALGDKPETDPIMAARKAAGMTDAEVKLVCHLLSHLVLFTLSTKYQSGDPIQVTIDAERMLLEHHRAIVLAEVAKAKLPAAAHSA